MTLPEPILAPVNCKRITFEELTKYNEAKGENEREIECSVCIEDFQASDTLFAHNKVVLIKDANGELVGADWEHPIHHKCIQAWATKCYNANKSQDPHCPTCRHPIAYRVVKQAPKTKIPGSVPQSAGVPSAPMPPSIKFKKNLAPLIGTAVLSSVLGGALYFIQLKATVSIAVGTIFALMSAGALFGVAFTLLALKHQKVRKVALQVAAVVAISLALTCYVGLIAGGISYSASGVTVVARLVTGKIFEVTAQIFALGAPALVTGLPSTFID